MCHTIPHLSHKQVKAVRSHLATCRLELQFRVLSGAWRTQTILQENLHVMYPEASTQVWCMLCRSSTG